jgi:hypothetical protein
LRSLKDGRPHPRAAVLTLTPNFRPSLFPNIGLKFTVQIIGDILGILFEANARGLTILTKLVIWDWTTGIAIFVSQIQGDFKGAN